MHYKKKLVKKNQQKKGLQVDNYRRGNNTQVLNLPYRYTVTAKT